MALTFNKLNRQRLKRHRSKNKRGHVHSYQKMHKQIQIALVLDQQN